MHGSCRLVASLSTFGWSQYLAKKIFYSFNPSGKVCMSVRLFYRWKGKTHYKEQCGRSFQKIGPHCSSAICFPSHPWCRINIKKANVYLGGGDISPSTHMQIPVKWLGTNKGTWQKKNPISRSNSSEQKVYTTRETGGGFQCYCVGNAACETWNSPCLRFTLYNIPPKLKSTGFKRNLQNEGDSQHQWCHLLESIYHVDTIKRKKLVDSNDGMLW